MGLKRDSSLYAVPYPPKDFKMNYNAFDPFLSRSTWHTGHDNDLFAFYRCLAKVIDSPNFNPESMGKYFQEKKQVTSDHPFASSISDLVSYAWAVRDYFAATGGGSQE